MGRMSPEVRRIAGNAFSRTTWGGRSRVMHALLSRGSTSPKMLARATRRFLDLRIEEVRAGRIAAETAARDVPHVKWVWRLRGWELPANLALLLQTLQRGLRCEPKQRRKALPLTRAVLFSVLQRLRRRRATKPLCMALLLAFETASRVDDILKLDPAKAFRRTRRNELLVMWDFTKANPTAESRADHQQIVSNPALLPLADNADCLLQVSKSQVRRLLKSIPVRRSYVVKWQRLDPSVIVRTHFTGHSLKRGRGAELWRLAADGLVTVDTVMHTMKHLSIEAALSYAPDPAMASEAIRRCRASSNGFRSRKGRNRQI